MDLRRVWASLRRLRDLVLVGYTSAQSLTPVRYVCGKDYWFVKSLPACVVEMLNCMWRTRTWHLPLTHCWDVWRWLESKSVRMPRERKLKTTPPLWLTCFAVLRLVSSLCTDLCIFPLWQTARNTPSRKKSTDVTNNINTGSILLMCLSKPCK